MAELGEAPPPSAMKKAVEPKKTEPSAAILPTPSQLPASAGEQTTLRPPPLMNAPVAGTVPYPYATPGAPQAAPGILGAQQPGVWPGAFNPWQAYYGMMPGVTRPMLPQVTAAGITPPGVAALGGVAGYTNQWLQQLRMAAPPPPPGTQ